MNNNQIPKTLEVEQHALSGMIVPVGALHAAYKSDNRAVALARNGNAGRLLFRIIRLHRVTKVKFAGRRWCARTRLQWARECNLSFKQVTTALKKLDEGGLITREQHRYGLRVPLFVQPTDECLAALLSETMDHPLWSRPKVGQKGHPQEGAGTGTPYIEHSKKQVKETNKIASGFAVATLDADIEEKEESGKKEDEAEAEKSTLQETTCAVQNADGGTCGQPYLPDPGKVSTLEAIWRGSLGASALPVPTITQKMRGQFKYLTKTLASGSGPALVSWACKNWSSFTYKAEQEHGAFNLPDVPHLGYLVKYAHVAVDLMAKAEANAVHSIAGLVEPNSDAAKKAAYAAQFSIGGAS